MAVYRLFWLVVNNDRELVETEEKETPLFQCKPDTMVEKRA